MRVDGALAIMLVAAMHAVSAQTAPPAFADLQELQAGARIRLAAPGVMPDRRIGTVVSRTSDTVVVAGDAPAAHVPISAITSLEVSRGRSRVRGMIRGLRWGVPIGLLAGVAVAPAAARCTRCESAGAYAASAVAWFTFGGMVYGAGIGALFPHERWDRYDLSPRVGAALEPAR